MKRILLTLAGVFLTSCLPLSAATKLDLNRNDQERCRQVLLDGLRSDEFWPSMHAAEGLTLGGFGRTVRQHLEGKLPEEKDHQRRCGLARELARAGDQAKSRVLMDILKDPDSDGRVHAAESLFKVGWTGSSKPLEQAFAQSKDLRLKFMAAAALGKRDNKKALKFLRHQIRTQKDPKMIFYPAWILGRIGDQSDIPLIRKRLSDAPDAWTRAFLEHALAGLGDAKGRESLRRNLQSDDARLRAYAATWAGDAGMTGVKEQLIEQLEDENLDARIRAAQTLLFLSR